MTVSKSVQTSFSNNAEKALPDPLQEIKAAMDALEGGNLSPEQMGAKLRSVFEAVQADRQERDALRQERDALHEEVYTDPVTGGHNRKAAMRFLKQITESMQDGEDIEFVVAMVDADNFKTINDTCGHEQGDEILCDIVDVVSGMIGEDDFVGRLGGDEFIIIMHKTKGRDLSPERVELVIEKNLQGMGVWPFDNTGDMYHAIGASIGQHTMSRQEMNALVLEPEDYIAHVLKQADEAMYDHKKGKDERLSKENRNAIEAIQSCIDDNMTEYSIDAFLQEAALEAA